MKKVDLNVDIGEGFAYDEALLQFATSANVCCGEHAGSPELTLQTIEMCRRKGVRVGAHPGFPDRESMGRRIPDAVTPYAESLTKQAQAAADWAAYIKPHGAFYNLLSLQASSKEPRTSAAIGAAIGMSKLTGLPLMLLPSSALFNLLPMLGGMPHPIAEGFADRRYMADGRLMPRSQPDAVLTDPDEIRAQVLELAPKVDSICLHGDTPGCLEFAEMVRKTLEDAGYEVGY
jgi:UPF0271 protein